MLRIRRYAPEDCPALVKLFYDTVHTVNARDYSQEQLNAWAGSSLDVSGWNVSLSAHYTLVAEAAGVIGGFGDMDETGYLDRLYVHRDYQSRGIGTALCDGLEREFQVKRILTHASVTARPFFEKRGYCVVKEQQIQCGGVSLTNYVMEKSLAKGIKQTVK